MSNQEASKIPSDKKETAPKKRDSYLDWIDVIGDRGTLQIEDKDPNRHYRWVRSQDPRRMEKMKKMGYRLENKETHQVKSPYADEGTGKAHVLNNELVLMSCDIDEYKARQQAKAIINKQKRERTPAPLVVKDPSGKAYKNQLEVEMDTRN